MVWYFNFCAPVLPTDPTINFHRLFQAGALILVFVLYFFFHVYYLMCGPDPLQEQKLPSNSQGSGGDESEKGLDQQSSNSDDKSISIGGGIKEQNSSYITFAEKTGEWKRTTKTENEGKSELNYQIIENVTILEVEAFFPIVIGHYSIAVSISMLYSPYMEQSISLVIFTILGIVLMILNSKRCTIAAFVIWGLMTAIIAFLILSASLEIGQTHWSTMSEQCFALDYVPLY